MNSKTNETHDFEPFASLIDDLEAPENRPTAPKLAADYKTGLRYKLLQQHEGKRLSHNEMFNLWRFAGAAIGLIVLVGAVLLFASSLSNRSTALGPAGGVQPVPTRTAVPDEAQTSEEALSSTFIESDVVGWSNAPLDVTFADAAQLEAYEIEETEEGLTLTLGWRSLKEQAGENRIFVHVKDEAGNLVYQSDSESEIIWSENEGIEETYFLTLPADVSDGRYDIIVGWYNATTGERLPASASNERMLVDGGTAVWLTDWGIENNDENMGQVWLISATQAERPSENAPIELEVTLGYAFDPDEEVFLKLSAAHPLWQQVSSNGRVPLDGLSEQPVFLDTNEGSTTFNVTVDPQELTQILSTNEPVLVAEMGYIIAHDDARGNELKFLAHETLTDFQIGLDTTEAITVSLDEDSGQVWLISATQAERPSANANIELEVTLGYAFDSDEEVFLKLSAAHPLWQQLSSNGRVPVDGLSQQPIFLDAADNSVTLNFTVNPQELQQILNTDEPVLLVEMGYIVEHDDGRGNEIKFLAHETFTEYPLDLTTANEVSYMP